MLAHQPPDAPGRGAEADMAQPGPDPAVALAMQPRAEDLRADVLDQRGVRIDFQRHLEDCLFGVSRGQWGIWC